MLKYVNKYLLTGSINISNTIPRRGDVKKKFKLYALNKWCKKKVSLLSITLLVKKYGEKWSLF